MIPRRFAEKMRERLQKEIGTVYKPHSGRLRFALAFPNTYHIGMSNLGFQSVYARLNSLNDVVCERAFLPDDPQEFEASGVKLFSVESLTPVREFDVVGFSLSYELDYPNALRVLSLSGVPLYAADRDAGFPLVIAGGPAATFNPESIALFVDAFMIGEAEEMIEEVVDVLREHFSEERDELLMRLAQVEGVYVPRFYEPQYGPSGTIEEIEVAKGAPARVRRRWYAGVDLQPAVSTILTPETEFSNMILAEVARGCGRQCRFCAAGYVYRPPRAASPDVVLDEIRRVEELASKSSDVRPRVGLLSASVFDHPGSAAICEALAENDRLFSISSTRADTLDSDIVALLRRGGHETLTIAPEAGTDRLRRVINKTITDEDVFRAARTAWDGGFRRLKLYFMIGLPTETDEDVEGIVSLAKAVAEMERWDRVNMSVSCFVPKPWTPFQWSGMLPEKELSARLSKISKGIRPVRRLEMLKESAREAIVQGVLARGDRRLAGALASVSDGSTNWRTAFRLHGIETAFYANRPRHKDEVLPWDVLDLGVAKDYLWMEYERSMSSVPTSACKVGVCRRCGVCHG